jgi:ABC-type branched-subunit amino acid transport system ATPase component
MDEDRCADEVLSLARVTKWYAAGVPGCSVVVRALDDVSLVARHGDAIAIVGAAGSGKSTLALCVAGVMRPDEGSIRWGRWRGRLEPELPAPALVDARSGPDLPDVGGYAGGLLVIDSVDAGVTPMLRRRLSDLVALARRESAVLVLGRSVELCRSLTGVQGPSKATLLIEGRLVALDEPRRASSRVAERLRIESRASVDRPIRVP